MLSILQAHGLDPGPTQRPQLAGAVSSFIANLPATALVSLLGTLHEVAAAMSAGRPVVLAAFCALNVVTGIAYGRLFQRAANDKRGAWLFGLAFGFIVWMLVTAPLLQWIPHEPTLVRVPAIGLLLGQLLWGLVLGLAFPFVHAWISPELEASVAHRSLGPESAVR